jgi:hypothetical protein
MLGRPVTPSRPSEATVKPTMPAASLAVPSTAVARPPMQDAAVRPTGYSYDGTPSVVRGVGPDDGSVRPMPVGPPATDPVSGIALHGGWRPAPTDPDAPVSTAAASIDSGLVGPAFNPAAHPGMDGSADCGCTGSNCNHNCGSSACSQGCSNCGNGGSCGGCGTDCCHFDDRWYVSAEYLAWWVKGDATPPLVTTGSVNDPIPGALGQPHTQILFGGSDLGSGIRSGARVGAGYWFTDDHALGVDGSFFFLGRQTNDFSATSFGNPPLFRPFHEAVSNVDTAEQVANVATARLLALAGTVTVDHTSSLWGAEGNLRANFICGPNGFIDLIGGFRVLSLDENLSVNESLVSLDTTGIGPRAGTTFNVNDSFQTQNRFYGGQLGAIGEWKMGRWVIDTSFKLGIGVTQQNIQISGATIIGNSGTSLDGTFPGGLLAQRTNIGNFTRNVFTLVPEVGLKVNYNFTDHLKGFVGYNFLYWSDVARPGRYIDTTVDRRQLAPPTADANLATRPAFAFNGSSFWAQGLTLGVEYRY